MTCFVGFDKNLVECAQARNSWVGDDFDTNKAEDNHDEEGVYIVRQEGSLEGKVNS